MVLLATVCHLLPNNISQHKPSTRSQKEDFYYWSVAEESCDQEFMSDSLPTQGNISRTAEKGLNEWYNMAFSMTWKFSAALKPLLINKMRKKRFDFAKELPYWTVEQLTNVMWSRESTFQVLISHRVQVRRLSGCIRYDHQTNRTPTPFYSRPSIEAQPSKQLPASPLS